MASQRHSDDGGAIAAGGAKSIVELGGGSYFAVSLVLAAVLAFAGLAYRRWRAGREAPKKGPQKRKTPAATRTRTAQTTFQVNNPLRTQRK